MKLLRFIHIFIIAALELIIYLFSLLKYLINACFTGIFTIEFPEYHITPIYVTSKTYEGDDIYDNEYTEQEGYMTLSDYIHQKGKKMWKYKNGIHESYKSIDEEKGN